MGRLVCHIVTNWRVARLDWPQIAKKRSTFLAILSNPYMVKPLELLKKSTSCFCLKIPKMAKISQKMPKFTHSLGLTKFTNFRPKMVAFSLKTFRRCLFYIW